MAIDYTGHCAFPKGEAQRRIDYLRLTRPDWYPGMHNLTDARDLGRFDGEIAREFGIEAKCVFNIFLLNKDWLDASRDAVEFVYEVFGTEKLVISYGNDSVRKPMREYVGVKIG
ncbi:MAG TPA: hypothetical protein VGD86_06575 [Devosia sp.]